MAESHTSDGGEAPANPLEGAQLSVLAQFIKDLSFESPNAPKSLQGPGENPKLEVNVNVNAMKAGEDTYEVDLVFEANAHSDDGVIYNVELVYGGLFQLTNFPDEILKTVVSVDCPTILFPFLRRIVADLTQEGGFPPLLMNPIDFAALHHQSTEQAAAEAEAEAPN